MKSKKFFFLTLVAIVLVLSQTEIAPQPVFALVETPLATRVDSTILYLGQYVAAKGFTVGISMYTPVTKGVDSFTKVAFAVALGEPWGDVVNYWKPYIGKMWVNVSGNSYYWPNTGSIVDNAGTGGACTDGWSILLDILVALLPEMIMELYQVPPQKEWQGAELIGAHWIKAIVREPVTDTAAANFWSTFEADGRQTLKVTAGADIWVLYTYPGGSSKSYVGSYSISFTTNVWVDADPMATLHFVVENINTDGNLDIAWTIEEELPKIDIRVETEYRDGTTIDNTVWGNYWDKTWDDAPGYGWDVVWYEFNSAQEYLEQNLKSHYWANMTPPGGGYNIMCWNNTKADTLLSKATSTPNALAKKSDIWKWQSAFMHDPPCIIIYYPSTPMCARGIAFNLHHPVLSNRYVRQAIAHAIPYGHIINITLPEYDIDAYQAKAPIHRDAKYTYGGVTVSLYCDDDQRLPPYEYNIAKALKYMEMWWYSQVGKDKMKGPRGDGDFSGFVELDDFYIWAKWWGKTTSQITFLPGQDQDPDWDNSGYVELPDFYVWQKAWGFYYPENSTTHVWSRSPVVPVGATEYPAIYVEPTSIEKTTYEPGMEFEVSIRTNYTGTDVTGWQLTLYYNPLVLQGVNVTNGDLITKEKDSSAQFMAGTFDNTAGRLSLTGAFFSFLNEPAPLTSGPGTLAKVTFKVVGWGDSGILLGDKTKLIGFTEDGWGTKIDIIDASTDPNHIQNGFFSNLVLTIRPNAPGKFTKWTAYPSGTPNWQCVDEAGPNDDADYVYWTPQPSKQDSYKLEDHTTETRNITNVRVVMYAKLASADDDQITMQLVINGMTYEGVTVNPTTTYAKYTSDWAINPSTGSAWTWSDIDALEAGFKCVKVGQTSSEHRITQLYVEVTLTPSYG